MGQPVTQQSSVRQAGESVMERLVGEQILELFTLADIAQRENQTLYRGLRRQVHDVGLGNEDAPVCVHEPEFDRLVRLTAGKGGEHDRLVVRRHPLAERPARQVIGVDSEQALDRGGGRNDRGVRTDDEDDVGSVRKQHAQTILVCRDQLRARQQPVSHLVERVRQRGQLRRPWQGHALVAEGIKTPDCRLQLRNLLSAHGQRTIQRRPPLAWHTRPPDASCPETDRRDRGLGVSAEWPKAPSHHPATCQVGS